MRTHHCGPPDRFPSSLRICRAAAFWAGATLSSRSKITASAALSIAFAIFFSLSAGTNSQERGARALAHQLAALVEAAVRPGDDAGVRPGLAFPKLDALAFAAQRVADEDGLRKDELVVAQVRHERAEGRVVDADPDHQPEGEDRIDQRLAELGLRRRLVVDVQRLRIVRQRGNQ